MSGETVLWGYLREGMRNWWDACRHEDSITTGVPDVSYGARGVQGWIELKVIAGWPGNAGTAVKIKHLAAWQRRWLTGRGKHGGGHVWLLLKVITPRTFLLFPWDRVYHIGRLNRIDLIDATCGIWFDRIDWTEFERIITK